MSFDKVTLYTGRVKTRPYWLSGVMP